jgi:hypothetical protein
VIVLETLAGRYRVVLREKGDAVAVSVFDRGAPYRAVQAKPCGALIRDERIRGDFATVAANCLADAQALEDTQPR